MFQVTFVHSIFLGSFFVNGFSTASTIQSKKAVGPMMIGTL